MKSLLRKQAFTTIIVIAFAATLPRHALSTGAAVSDADNEPKEKRSAEATSEVSANRNESSTEESVVEAPAHEEFSAKDHAWLGVSTSEVSEALAAQLNLENGAGLLITYIAPDGPAAKAGLHKNDVLVEFGHQSLVHPAQLQKLVRVQKAGEVVTVGFYRAGKQESTPVTLGKLGARADKWGQEERALEGDFGELHKHIRDLHLEELLGEQMHALRESLGNIKIDRKEVQEDVRRGMDEARKAIHDALRNLTNSDPLRKVLENFAHSGVIVDDKANVVVRSSGNNVKSMVRSDDNGTIVLISNPRLYLTAHDHDGKLLFDGPIESAEERAKVPRELWDRVEPLVDQWRAPAEQPDPKDHP